MIMWWSWTSTISLWNGKVVIICFKRNRPLFISSKNLICTYVCCHPKYYNQCVTWHWHVLNVYTIHSPDKTVTIYNLQNKYESFPNGHNVQVSLNAAYFLFSGSTFKRSNFFFRSTSVFSELVDYQSLLYCGSISYGLQDVHQGLFKILFIGVL